jgi:hypothetical protein
VKVLNVGRFLEISNEMSANRYFPCAEGRTVAGFLNLRGKCNTYLPWRTIVYLPEQDVPASVVAASRINRRVHISHAALNTRNGDLQTVIYKR